MLNVVAVLRTQFTPGVNACDGEKPMYVEHGAEYARKLFSGVRRHLSTPFVPYLITDAPDMAPDWVYTLPLGAPADVLPGWWAKVALFTPWMLRGKTLYLDLDNVPCASLDALVALEPDPLIMIDDQVHSGMANGSTMLCYPERLQALWHEYMQYPEEIRKEFSHWPNAADQAFIASRVRRSTAKPVLLADTLLPPGYFANSRLHVEQDKDLSAAHLIIGSWDPKPHMSTKEFYRVHWKD